MKNRSQILIAFFWIFSIVTFTLFEANSSDVSAAVPKMLMVYSKLATDRTPFYRVWSGAAWGSEIPMSTTSVDVRQIVVKCARFKEECIAVTNTPNVAGGSYIAAQVWNGTSWSATTTIENTFNSIYRNFDLEYENGTDRAILVTASDLSDPVYSIWNGSTWTATSSINTPFSGRTYVVELVSQRFSTSTKIAMIISGINELYGMEWDGSNWNNLGITSMWDYNGPSVGKKEVDVAYESMSGAAIFAWSNAIDTTSIYYKRWNGNSFTASSTISISTMGGAGEWIRLAANPYSATNTMMLGVYDAGNDINTAFWDGSAWTVHSEHDAANENILNMTFDVAFLNASTSGKGYLAYGNAATVSRKQWTGNDWSSASTAGDDTALPILDSSYEQEAMQLLTYQDSTSASDDITESHIIDGSATWVADAQIWAGAVIAAPVGFRIDMEPSRFFTYPTFTQSAYRFFENADNTTAGTALASAQDKPATTTSPGSQFRLRPLLHTASATSTTPEHEVVLQFATRSGVCDTSFSGESYATVTPTTNIAFYNNTSVFDGDTASINGSDPSHSGHTKRYQGYEEVNGATTTTDAIPGEDTIWDFSLIDNDGETATNSYCFRLVQRTGHLLSTYSVIPEIATYVKPTISQSHNKSYDFGSTASSTPIITVTDVGGRIISDENDLRVAIATSSINMLWDTSDTKAIFGGTASSSEVTSADVTFEGGGSVLVVDVVDDFDTGDTLTISGLSFTSFLTATSATAGVLGIFHEGASDITLDATTTSQTVAINGTLVLANHGSGQVSDQWDTLTPTTTTHHRFKLTGTGEEILVNTTTFSLSSITGVSTADLTSAKLYVDLNSNGVKDSADAIATSTKGAFPRPNAAGTFAQFTVSGCAANWDCVDEDTSDESTTRVFLLEAASEANATDSYNLPNPTGRTEVITNVKVTVRASQNNVTGGIRPLVVVGGAAYKATATSTPTASYVNYSFDWATDPSDASAWTWTDINSLEAGVYTSLPADASPSGAMNITQVWVEVSYEIPDGTVSISGATGSITFATSTPYRVGGAKNYLMYLTASNLASGDTMTVALTTANIEGVVGTTSIQSITPSGTATNITHTFDGGGATAPVLSGMTFNGGAAINLNESTYKWATSSFLITDAEYCTSITGVTAKAYVASSSNNGTLCSENDLNCYIGVGSTTAVSQCVATTTGNTCGALDTSVEYDCGFKLWYIARPTDTGDWATSIWSVSATATDDGALTGTATNTSQNIDVNTLSAFSISPGTIAYGTVAPGSDTQSTNQTTTLTNTGNIDIDPRLSGTAMNSADDTILVEQQEYFADPFTWGSGTDLTSTPTTLNITLPAPSATTTPVTDVILWGMGVPSGKRTGSYTGTNTFEI
ncbi:MAG: hypothetical protein AAB590_02720 [Patescibacteria group bacterium]